MIFENELTAKVMGEILAKGMSLSGVDLRKSVDSEAVKALGRIKHALADGHNQQDKLKKVEAIINEYNV